MAKREYTIVSASAMIERNGGKVTPSTKTVYHRDPGIKTLGAIDYLERVHKYHWTRGE